MIVKDEASIIEKTLRHVKPFIDAYAIVDTGSSDNTVKVIEDVLHDIHGIVTSMEWNGFASCRNRAIELGSQLGDFLFFLDADDLVSITASPTELKQQINASMHPVKILHGPISYQRICIMSTKSLARYKCSIHEVLVPTASDQIGPEIKDLSIAHNAIGISNRNRLDN